MCVCGKDERKKRTLSYLRPLATRYHIQEGGTAEIDQFDVRVFIFRNKHDIGAVNVPMHNVLAMEVRDSGANLPHDMGCHLFRVGASI